MRHSPLIRSLLWGLLLTCCLAPATHAESPILVGMLEDIEPDNDLSPAMTTPHVRLAFEYHDSTWHEFSREYPAKVEWTVVFDGRRIGTLQSRAPKSTVHMPANAGVETIATPSDKLPHIRAGATRFTYAGYAARTRPLICDFDEYPSFDDHWFVLNGSSAQYLGSHMTPLDAADLAGTGSSAWIFQTTTNEGGDTYELFYGNFSKDTSFSWAYH